MIGDRVQETTQTTGTGTLTLDGAAGGRRTFVAAIGLAKTCFYVIEDGDAWEIGIGTTGNSGGADTLSRDTVIASSNAGSKINLAGGAKSVMGSPPMEAYGAIGERHRFGVTTGADNAYTLALAPAPRALVDGMGGTFRAHEACDGACTLNVVGGAKPLRRADGTTALATGDIVEDGTYIWRYNGELDVHVITSPLPATFATTDETKTGTVADKGVTPAAAKEAFLAVGKHTIGVPAAALMPAITNGATKEQVETSSQKINYTVLKFPFDSTKIAWFAFPAPKSANETVAIQIRNLKWEEEAAATQHGVAFGMAVLAAGDADTIDTAPGSEVVVTDTGAASGKVYSAAESGDITPGGTWAEGDMLYLRIRRIHDNGSDTLDKQAWLHGFEIIYTVGARNDA